MERSKEIEIETRLGIRRVDLDRVVRFPRGLAGFEGEQDFVLLQIRPEAPLLILQSMTNPMVGLLVADPYSFLQSYQVMVPDAEQKMLQLERMEEAAILVTVSIPAGNPKEAALNLTGPIVINHKARLGAQVPQSTERPSQINLYSLKPVKIESVDRPDTAPRVIDDAMQKDTDFIE